MVRVAWRGKHYKQKVISADELSRRDADLANVPQLHRLISNSHGGLASQVPEDLLPEARKKTSIHMDHQANIVDMDCCRQDGQGHDDTMPIGLHCVIKYV